MSEYILSLDLSQDNTSWIRFVFSDLKNSLMLSSTIDKFFKSDYGFFEDVTSDSGKKDTKGMSLENEKGD